ncbi:zinc finger protein 431-like [Sabethes cyaneus]|uniref:zinc finger protein 431-like n=1 Tax=Sabethes cyaneus TaxID=53552 RepID=UPI00237E6CC7|nr:zinc finger protein 431-like [Sabethes cyaneus]
MPCIVPTCLRTSKAMRSFPDDRTLAARWFEAIEIGCGYPVQSVNDIQPEICSSHFLASAIDSYEEPSVFVNRYKICNKISSCRVCLAFYPRKDMISLEGSIGEKNISALLESMDMGISKDHFLQLICLPCTAHLDILTSLYTKFTQSEQFYQELIHKSQDYNTKIETCVMRADSSQEKVIMEIKELDLVDNQENSSEESKPKMRRSSSRLKRSRPLKKENANNNNEKKTKRSTNLNKKLERYCYICNTFQTDCNQLMVHLTETHTSEAGYRCEECFLDIPLLSAYNRHLSRHDESGRPIKCSICSVRFVSQLQVKVHENKVHGANHNVKQPQSKTRLMVCDKCGDVFDKRNIKVHMQQVHQIECQPKCNICNKIFTAKVSLERHMLLHTDTKPYNCEECGASFRRLLNYRQHKSMVHEGINPHVCSECNEGFKNYQQLYVHKQKVHDKKPPPSQRYQQYEPCKLCDLRFAKGSLLMEHIQNVHAYEQYPTFPCPHCPKTFMLPSRLATHKLIHSDRHVCTLCGARHAERKKLQYHMDLKHPDGRVYACTVCSKTFTSLHQLNLHIPVHTKGLLFKCEFCSKSFMRKCQLVIHIRTHTGEKPHQCDKCSKRFKDDGTFSKHKKKCKSLGSTVVEPEYLKDESILS